MGLIARDDATPPTGTPCSASPRLLEQGTASEASEVLTLQGERTDQATSSEVSEELALPEDRLSSETCGRNKSVDAEAKQPSTQADDGDEKYQALFPSLGSPGKRRIVPQAVANQDAKKSFSVMPRSLGGTPKAAGMHGGASKSSAAAYQGSTGRCGDDSKNSAAASQGYGRQFPVGDRSAVGELQGPQAGGRVHFSGCLMWKSEVRDTCSKPYQEDIHSEYVGVGRYPQNSKAFPKAIQSSFDSVAVDAGTRVIIYSEPNFKGKVLWDRVGPALLVNVQWKTHQWPFTFGKPYSEKLFENWEGKLQTIFPPEVREFSCSDMHLWNTGSLIIQGGQSVPQEVDQIDEYKLLANPRY